MGNTGRRWANNPPCVFCKGYTRKIGIPHGRQQYHCADCGRLSSEATPAMVAKRALREQRARIRKASVNALSLGEYFAIAEGKDPRNQEVVGPLAHYVRRSEYARRRGVSRQRVHHLITEGRLRHVQVGGLMWVREDI